MSSVPDHNEQRAQKASRQVKVRLHIVMPAAKDTTPRAWQRMLSGRRLDLLNPSPLDVEIEDIAHGLARVARWNGQTKGAHAYSVAQHCVLVEKLAVELKPRLSREARLMALLHDSPEYVVGDLISPFKAAVGLDYKAFENRLLAAIHIRFGLPPKPPVDLQAVLKRADIISAFHEATQLAGFSLEEARRIFGVPPKGIRTPRMAPLPTAEAQSQFLERFKRLTA
jgi:5'-deoxynucleotidase YfbR-like HD superfamily hydrolase